MAGKSNCTHTNNPIDYTATGTEAVLKCDAESYCCDANRPDEADVNGRLGCCDTSKKPSDFFGLPNGTPIFVIGNVTASTSLNPSSTTTSTASSSGAPTNNGIVNTSRAGTIVVLTVVIDPASSISSIITLTIAAPQSTSNASTSTSTQTSSSKNPGIKIGGGVGVPIGILALAAVVFFLWRRQKNKKPFVRNYVLPTNSMHINNADLSSPYTTTSASPELDHRASGRYSGMGSGPGHTEYRGVSIAGLGRHHRAAGFPDSPSRFSEFDSRNSQMSEPVGLDYQPHELPEQAYG